MRKKTQKKPVIAMPSALWYHHYPGLWTAFFRHLGFTVIRSGETVRKTVERAALISESEHCLPLKLHDAHLDEIVDGADVVFIPRILSTLPDHIACPKLGALPDCARAQFGDRIRIVTVDVDEDKRPLRRSLLRLGRGLGAGGRRLRSAADAALDEMRNLRNRQKAGCDPGEDEHFLILGHPYNLHDRYMSGPILSKLEALGVRWRFVDYAVRTIEPEPIKWDACSIMHDALLGLDRRRCMGVIQLSSFNCGCDSVVIEMFRDLLKMQRIPYMTLVLDENEALAGVDTRLEAFVDSIGWKNAQTRF